MTQTRSDLTPFAGAFKSARTGHRLPAMTPTSLGPYAEAECFAETFCYPDEVHRIEARIGCQIAVPHNASKGLVEAVARQAKGSVMRYVYGPIHRELVETLAELRYGDVINAEGRLRTMISSLDRAVAGDI